MLINHLDMILFISESTCWLSLTRRIIICNLFSELLNNFIHTVVSPLWTVSKPKIIIHKKTVFVHVDPHAAISSLQLLN